MNEGRVAGSYADNENWFVAQLKPNALSIARRHLRQQGFRCFGPQRKETRRSGSRIVTRDRPLFPGYLFVHFDPESSSWRKINSTRGIARLVLSNSNAPRPLPSDFIAGLRARCDKDDVLQETEELKTGDQIRVIAGPFADFISKVEHVTDDKRVQVLLGMMNQDVRVRLPSYAVQKAG